MIGWVGNWKPFESLSLAFSETKLSFLLSDHCLGSSHNHLSVPDKNQIFALRNESWTLPHRHRLNSWWKEATTSRRLCFEFSYGLSAGTLETSVQCSCSTQCSCSQYSIAIPLVPLIIASWINPCSLLWNSFLNNFLKPMCLNSEHSIFIFFDLSTLSKFAELEKIYFCRGSPLCYRIFISKHSQNINPLVS